MKASAISDYLAHREQATRAAAAQAGRELAALHADRYFFRAWWLEPITTCVRDSPAITDPPGVLLDRLAARFGLQLSDASLPHCPRCRAPLRLPDVQIPRPTGRCRPCSNPPAPHPTATPIRPVRAAPDPDVLDLLEVA